MLGTLGRMPRVTMGSTVTVPIRAIHYFVLWSCLAKMTLHRSLRS